jgi:HEAT repeat protein
MPRHDTRRAAAVAGHQSDEATARALIADPEPKTRATALGALARMGRLTDADLNDALGDDEPAVRRRAAELASDHPRVALDPLLADRDHLVVEAVCWALGERGADQEKGVVAALARAATGHRDALCREAAVAALGAIGDAAGLPAILAATADKPAVRRRAVLALAPFDGPEVTEALARAREDRDWQVRQAAEDLTDPTA